MGERIDLVADGGSDLVAPYQWTLADKVTPAMEGPWPAGWTARAVFSPHPGQVTLELDSGVVAAEGSLNLYDDARVVLTVEPEGLEAIGRRWTFYELTVRGPADEEERLAEGLLLVRASMAAGAEEP